MFKQLKRNKVRSILALILMSAVLFFLGGVLISIANYHLFWLGGLGGIGLALATMVKSYYLDSHVHLDLKTENESISEDQQKYVGNIAEELAVASGLANTPTINIAPLRELNAFSSGKNRNDATITVTQGLVENLSRCELQAVMAHETAHIVNNDVFYMALLSSVSSALGKLADIQKSLEEDSRHASDDTWHTVKVYLSKTCFFLFGHLLAKMVHLSASASREYMADAGAVIACRNPGALASALHKMAESHSNHGSSLPSAVAALLTVAAPDEATHPNIDLRIAILRNLAKSGLNDAAAYAACYAQVTGDEATLAETQEPVLSQA